MEGGVIMKVAVYCRVATKEQCNASPDVNEASEKILADMNAARYLLRPKRDIMLRCIRKKQL